MGHIDDAQAADLDFAGNGGGGACVERIRVTGKDHLIIGHELSHRAARDRRSAERPAQKTARRVKRQEPERQIGFARARWPAEQDGTIPNRHGGGMNPQGLARAIIRLRHDNRRSGAIPPLARWAIRS